MLPPRSSSRARHRALSPPATPRTAILSAAVLAALSLDAPTAAQVQFAPLGQRVPGTAGGAPWLATGDVDGDGDVDLVHGDSGIARLALNDGRGHFTDVTATQIPAGSGRGFTVDVALSDVDGDSDLDLIVAKYLGEHRLYVNDGNGVFTDVTANQMPSHVAGSTSVVVGDIDGDGDNDLVFADGGYYGGYNRVYINDGSGVFTDESSTRLPSNPISTTGTALGDVDSDGDLDLIFVNKAPYSAFYGYVGAQDDLLLNDGSGTFTAAPTPLPSFGVSNAVACGDADGDGDLDLLIANEFSASFFNLPGPECQLLLNSGTGVFTVAPSAVFPLDNEQTLDAAFSDIDGDGDLDILLSHAGPGLALYVNSGTGGYADATSTRMSAIGTFTRVQAMATADLDGDGDPDLVFGGASDPVGTFMNLLRQLDAPTEPQIGQAFTLDIYARYGTPRAFDVALPYLSLSPANLQVPGLGTLGIDPRQSAPLPALLIPSASGVAQATFPIPNDPTLAGVEFFAQALHVSFPLSNHLTNPIRAVVR